MRAIGLAGVAIVASAVSGCASGGFRQVSFAGETSTAGSEPANGKTVHVVRNTRMRDSLLEARIRYKLQEFLLQKGYTLAAADTADLYVLATFGSGERMVAATAPVFREAESRPRVTRSGVVSHTYLPDRIEYLRVPLVKNSVWLQVLSSDARHYRSTGQVRNLWRGESAMVGKSESMGSLAPYLIVPAMRFFGRSTEEIVTVDVMGREAAWR